MCKLDVPPRYEQKIINIHPSLLPAFGGKGFYGNRVHQAVLMRGCKITGCTVHFVDNVYDHGPILGQKTVNVEEGDTVEALGNRVQNAERELFPEVINLMAAGRIPFQ